MEKEKKSVESPKTKAVVQENDSANNEVGGTPKMENVNIIKSKYEAMHAELSELSNEFEKEAYTNQAYLKDSKVFMPGQQFAKMSKIIKVIDQQINISFESLEYQQKHLEAMLMTLMEANLMMMRMHKENVLAGNSSDVSELEQENAKINIKAEKVPSKGKTPPKAKVIKMKQTN